MSITEKGYNYPIKIKIALAKNIQLVWQYHYTTYFVKYQVVCKKMHLGLCPGQYFNTLRLEIKIGIRPTGYTPCELPFLKRHTSCFVSPWRNTRGAICARLACASTDSLALDYVACGSFGRSKIAPKGA